MSSPPRSEPERLLAPDWRIEATPEDIAALRSAGVRTVSPNRYAVLEAASAFAWPPRRETAAGWAPFHLEAESGRSFGSFGDR